MLAQYIALPILSKDSFCASRKPTPMKNMKRVKSSIAFQTWVHQTLTFCEALLGSDNAISRNWKTRGKIKR